MDFQKKTQEVLKKSFKMYYSHKDRCAIYIDVSRNILQNLQDFLQVYNLGFQIIISNPACLNWMGILPAMRSRKKKFLSCTLPIPVSKLFLLKESLLLPYL